MHAKKVVSDSKAKNKLAASDNWSILKEIKRLFSSFL
jgi:hypothetical protein